MWIDGTNNFDIGAGFSSHISPIVPFTNSGPLVGGIKLHSSPSSDFEWIINRSGNLVTTSDTLYDGFILPRNGVYEANYSASSVWPPQTAYSNFNAGNSPSVYPDNPSTFHPYSQLADPASALSLSVIQNGVTIQGSVSYVYDETTSFTHYNFDTLPGQWSAFPELDYTFTFKGNAGDLIQLKNNNGIDNILILNASPFVSLRSLSSTGTTGTTITFPFSTPIVPPLLYRSVYIGLFVQSPNIPSFNVTDTNNNIYTLASQSSIGNNYLAVYYIDYNYNPDTNTTNAPLGGNFIVTNTTGTSSDMLHLIIVYVNNTDTNSYGGQMTVSGSSTTPGTTWTIPDINDGILNFVMTPTSTTFFGTPHNILTGAVFNTSTQSGAVYFMGPFGLVNQPVIGLMSPSSEYLSISVLLNVGFFPLFVDTPSIAGFNIKLLSE